MAAAHDRARLVPELASACPGRAEPGSTEPDPRARVFAFALAELHLTSISTALLTVCTLN